MGREKARQRTYDAMVHKAIEGEAMNNTSDCGGPNGIRTRVYGPPRAFVSRMATCTPLTQFAQSRD